MNALFLLCVVLVPAACSFLIAGQREGIRLSALLTVAGLLCLAVLWHVDDSIPFAGNGDDQDYLNASRQTFNSLSDWVDVRRYKRTHEQAGYPLLLAWVHQFVGDSLYHKKSVNVLLFLMIAVTWFKIGLEIAGRRLAFICALGVLLMTPLWFYWMFLFKDMAITLLQSIFILGVIQSLSSQAVGKGYLLITVSTILLIPFRSKLALVNLAVLAGATMLRMGSSQSWKASLLRVVLTGGIIVSILVVGRNAELLREMGVAGEHRALDSQSVQADLDYRGQIRTTMVANAVKFPFLYLVGEVAAFNPRSWDEGGSSLIRGLSMVPWIAVGLPLFVIGTWRVLRSRTLYEVAVQKPAAYAGTQALDPIQPERVPLMVLLLFVLLYAGVAWFSADTTRWRMPAMPAMGAIAGFAWITMDSQQRLWMLGGWGLLLSASCIAYYAVLR